MYSSHHAAVGVALTVGGYAIAGPVGAFLAAPLAFISHTLVDAFGESAYGPSFPPSKQTLLWEGIPFLVFLLAAYLSGIWWVFALGWVASMWMDLWDKGNYVLFGEFGRTFHPVGRKPKWKLSILETKALAIMASAVYILLALGIR